MLSGAISQTYTRARIYDRPSIANDNSKPAEPNETSPQDFVAQGYVRGAPLTEWEWVFCWWPHITIHGARTHAFTELRWRRVADQVSADGMVLSTRWQYR